MRLTVESRLIAVPGDAAFRVDETVVFGDWGVAADVTEGGYPGFDITFGELGGVGRVGGSAVHEVWKG